MALASSSPRPFLPGPRLALVGVFWLPKDGLFYAGIALVKDGINEC